MSRPTTRGALPLLAGLALLAGCANQTPAARVSSARLFSVDERGGAKQCTVPAPLTPTSGGTTEVAMTLVNDGGWCGVLVGRTGPRPFDAPLMSVRPQHGRVQVYTVGDHTRLAYTPDPGTSGSDAFGVRLLPDNTVVRVAVTVEPGAAPPAPPPSQPAAAAPTPAQRRATPARPPARTQPRRQ